MRLLFDARVLQPHFPGIGRYARSLLEALARVEPGIELTLLTEARAERLALPGARWLLAPSIFSPLSQLVVPWQARALDVDLFHAPYYLYPYSLSIPIVLTLHDLIPLEFPDMIPGGVGRRLYRPLNRVAARRAAHVLTDSDGARRAILRHLSVGADRVTTVPLAADPFFMANPAVEREPFFFSLLSNKPHKNGARLIEAFAATDPARHGTRLLLAGPYDADWPSFETLAAEAGVGEWVSVLGRLSDEALRDHYARCLAFIFPSFAEGFGLPVLEAMRCGAPVAIADRSPMRELAGEAALHFDPFDVTSITGALRHLLANPALRLSLSAQSREQAASFSWERTARETLLIYEQVVINRR